MFNNNNNTLYLKRVAWNSQLQKLVNLWPSISALLQTIAHSSVVVAKQLELDDGIGLTC